MNLMIINTKCMFGIYGACPMDLRKTLIYDSILRCIRIIIIEEATEE